MTLVLGVLGMHALVLIGSSPAASGSHAAGPALVAAMSGAVAHVPSHDAAVSVDSIAAPVDHTGQGGGHGSMPSMLHHALHLCLAILAALLVVGAVALVLWRTLGPDRAEVPIGVLVRRVPRLRPPSTSVRLAQLCVLRN